VELIDSEDVWLVDHLLQVDQAPKFACAADHNVDEVVIEDLCFMAGAGLSLRKGDE